MKHIVLAAVMSLFLLNFHCTCEKKPAGPLKVHAFTLADFSTKDGKSGTMTLSIAYRGKSELGNEIKERNEQIRDIVSEIASNRNSAFFASIGELETLKSLVKKKINGVLLKGRIEKVYVSNIELN